MPDFLWKRAAEITPDENAYYWLADGSDVELVMFVDGDDFNPESRFYNEDVEINLSDNPFVFPFVAPHPPGTGDIAEREALAYDLTLWAMSELAGQETPEGTLGHKLLNALVESLGPYEETRWPIDGAQ